MSRSLIRKTRGNIKKEQKDEEEYKIYISYIYICCMLHFLNNDNPDKTECARALVFLVLVS